MHGDLIETFKIINGLVDHGHNMFATNTAYQACNLNIDLMTSFAIELLNFGPSCHYACKIQQVSMPLMTSLSYLNLIPPNGFWKLSKEIFNRISNKSEHLNYLLANSDVAVLQNILF